MYLLRCKLAWEVQSPMQSKISGRLAYTGGEHVPNPCRMRSLEESVEAGQWRALLAIDLGRRQGQQIGLLSAQSRRRKLGLW